MPGCDWIICERTNRWASGLRLAIDRQVAIGTRYRLRETRHLSETLLAVERCPDSLVAVEVHRQNLSDILDWLALAERRFPQSRCIALVDRSFAFGDGGDPSQRPDSLSDLCDSLREAGAVEIALSPRDLVAALELARRHLAVIDERREHNSASRPYVERVWAALPWQEA